ncbi:MAG: acetolactate decarboxylase [Methanogenium sp.]|nr:acetolactate decarboxylase [Methanogenium sp.]
MVKNKILLAFTGIAILIILFSGFNILLINDEKGDNLYQVSTIDALLEGTYDGSVSFGKLKEHGNFGIGTFDHLDGEMIGLDGIFYQVRSDGSILQVHDEMTTPFAAVCFFEPEISEEMYAPMNMTEFETWAGSFMTSPNYFYAIRLDGTFPSVKTRSVPRQEKPYPRLADVVKEQVFFNLTQETGTIVGLWSPAFVEGINVPAYHLHFINDKRTAGGHVLEFQAENGTLSIDRITEFSMVLPDSNEFAEVNLTGGLASELTSVEKISVPAHS